MASQPTMQMPSRLRNLLGLTAAIVLVLGLLGSWIGLREVLPTASFTDLLGQYVQLFKFDWQKPDQYDGDIPTTLALAQVLLPVSALALIGLYGVQSLARWASQQARNRVIVVGNGVAAETIAEHLSQPSAFGRKVFRVDSGDQQTLLDNGVRHARAVVVCGDDVNDASRNVTVAGTAFAANRRSDFTAHVLVGDPGLALALQARRLVQADDGNRRLRVSNVDELAARRHLADAPIPRHTTPHLLVVGGTTFGREIIVEFARQRAEREPEDQPTGRPVVTLVAANAAEVVQEIDDRWPFVRHVLQIRPVTQPLHQAMLEMPQRPYRSYFCDDDEVQAIRDALTAATRWEPERDSVVVRTSGLTARSDAFAKLFDDLGGALVTVSRYHAAAEAVLQSVRHPQAHLEEFARAIHKGYLDEARRRRRPVGSAPNLVPWEQLAPELQASNIEQAKDFGRRLAVIHCTVAPRTRLAVPFFFRPGEVETLAREEHQKWRDSNRNVRPWEELAPEMRAISRAIVVETPLRYDRILERQGLQIVRLASAPAPQVASSITFTSDQIERMAQKVHEEFLAFEQAHGKQLYDPASPAMKPWAELDETFREANRAQVRDIPAKLELLELQLVPADSGQSVDFDEDMVEMLARYEHERWMAERMASGLTYGPVRTETTHPALVPWLYLSEEVQDKDRSAVRTIPAVVAAAGFALRRAVATPPAVVAPRADEDTTLILPR